MENRRWGMRRSNRHVARHDIFRGTAVQLQFGLTGCRLGCAPIDTKMQPFALILPGKALSYLHYAISRHSFLPPENTSRMIAIFSSALNTRTFLTRATYTGKKSRKPSNYLPRYARMISTFLLRNFLTLPELARPKSPAPAHCH